MPLSTEGKEMIISEVLPAEGKPIGGVIISGAFPVIEKQEQQ